MTVSLADGVDVEVLRTTERLSAHQARRRATTASQIDSGAKELSYPTFATWRGELRREPPRRPDPEAPASPPAFRNEAWKFSLQASVCGSCGTRSLPPQRVCFHCHAVGGMSRTRLADTVATITTFTVDHLAYSMSPPVILAVLDFDGGSRFQCELTDVRPDEVRIGDRMAMTFRRMYTARNGVHNYFWKAGPLVEDYSQRPRSVGLEGPREQLFQITRMVTNPHP